MSESNDSENVRHSLLEGWNTPANLVTFARIILVVVYIALTVLAGPEGRGDLTLRWIAAVLFIVAASTDKIDGYLARSRNEVTELGKLMDPIADKLLMCSALVIFAAFGEFAWAWLITILFLIREIGITVMRFFVMERPGGKVIAAAWPGKLKTVFQSISLSMFMVPMWSLSGVIAPGVDWTAWYYGLSYVLLLVALVLCLYSGCVYLRNTFGRR
ncbi:CDP-diacylglycerol--glycerol-3-phosphate 3-phosphatidyltransferase [Bifidobacterium sp. SMB2]|uniref:CDP-diacylglycerol--glycerol-3-phosphate 3-phosphatidyltransferase n=1 Tax=Bifidobacterium saimiriisciurei TaxID=2661627 RepID=A0ABX0CGX3_9BIFI|nr:MULTISPECIES: CDP-diacylglycerol--glycerol-3-phosphate 3-phosphatidyltransferase [Bifidobacterium]NEG95817.1 CDP-diacylglycerol--glycerol-3-phosphate 3-phosphatidyltransferase [Bifidobacterium sp. SMB2]NEH12114.1 CDP-diacylglycerol--glycerol-3-phosphate 3-phosphatidyltransferase [Bifidobacterium saimiriisciurei]